MSNELPMRKHPRLQVYDYSQNGAYFVTICTQNRRCILSHIVGRGLAPAVPELTQYGQIAEQELYMLQQRYPSVRADQYVIMPNHIHVLLMIENVAAGASPRPTVSDVVCAYKSLVTRKCGIGKIFQTSFYDHVIRNQSDYDEIYRYIENNPVQWEQDELYVN